METEDIFEHHQKTLKILDDMTLLYNLKERYTKGLSQLMSHYDKYSTEIDIIGLRKLIVDYQTKVKKKGLVKDLPLVDLSPSIRQMLSKDIKEWLSAFIVKETPEQLIISTKLRKPPVLPFKHCFLYASFCGVLTGLEIKDWEDGNYRGNLWIAPFHDKIIIQAKVLVGFDEDAWRIFVDIENRKRPLGQPLDNMCAIMNHLTKIDVDKQTGKVIGKIKGGAIMGSNYQQIMFSLLYFFGALGSYKSKRLYKTDNDIYVYADGLQDDDYIDETYASAKEIDGWIVGGHWKILPKGQYGVTPNGTKIKDITWVDPYLDQTRVVETSRGQSTHIVKNHAIQRAKERYDLDLNTTDLQNIANDILAGKATKLSVRDKQGLLKKITTNISGCYRLKYKKKLVDVVFTRGDERKSYRVATFLPKPKDTKINIIDCADYARIKSDYLCED